MELEELHLNLSVLEDAAWKHGEGIVTEEYLAACRAEVVAMFKAMAAELEAAKADQSC